MNSAALGVLTPGLVTPCKRGGAAETMISIPSPAQAGDTWVRIPDKL